MERGYIEAFLMLVKERSFTRAAQSLNLTQSAVTTRIQSLETHLRRKLFTRTNRRVELTPAGQTVYPYLKRIFELMDECEVSTRFDQLYENRLDIGVVEPLLTTDLVASIATYRDNFPKIAIRTQSGSSESIIHGIMDGVIDIGIVSSAPENEELEIHTLSQEPIILIGQPDLLTEQAECPCPWSTTRVIHSKNVFCHWSSPFNEWFARECRTQHIPSVETTQYSMFMECLKHGYIGFAPKSFCSAELASGMLAEIPYEPQFSIPKYSRFLIRSKSTGKRDLVDQWIAHLGHHPIHNSPGYVYNLSQ